ncbi:MAG: ABC transporter substrate-binding protein [Deltaproteobacteria bacterium]|nr:ABC transporter substrate-binding protein [Deltaproteobacteria bacterium]MBI3079061.1 ABC transporter substrate-binding protein [Deltaproteobacteria bacterium]
MGTPVIQRLDSVSRRQFLGGAGSALLLGLGGSLLAPRGASAQKKYVVGIVNTGTSAIPSAIITEMNLAAKYGGDLEFKPFDNLNVQFTQFFLGKTDMSGAFGPISGAIGRLEGRPIQYVSPSNQNHTCLIARADAPYTRMEELIGKNVGWFGLPSEASAGFLMVAQSRGIDAQKQFRLRKVTPPLSAALVDKGELDAGLAIEASLSRLLATGKYRVIGKPLFKEWQEITGNTLFPIGGLGAREETIRNARSAVVAFVRAWDEAIELFNKDVKGFLQKEWMKKALGLSADKEIEIAAQRIAGTFANRWGPNGEKEMEFYLQQAVKAGVLKRFPDGFLNPITA